MKSSPQLIKIFKKYGVTAAYLFGSQARGKTHAKSDVDIAVRYKKSPKLSEILALTHALSTYYKKPADVADLGAASLQLQFRVYQARSLLYAKNPREEAFRRFRALSFYYDNKYYFDRFTQFEINRLAAKGL